MFFVWNILKSLKFERGCRRSYVCVASLKPGDETLCKIVVFAAQEQGGSMTLGGTCLVQKLVGPNASWPLQFVGLMSHFPYGPGSKKKLGTANFLHLSFIDRVFWVPAFDPQSYGHDYRLTSKWGRRIWSPTSFETTALKLVCCWRCFTSNHVVHKASSSREISKWIWFGSLRPQVGVFLEAVACRNSTWMPTSEPFQWVPYKDNYHLDMTGIGFGGQELFSGFAGSFQLDRRVQTHFKRFQRVTPPVLCSTAGTVFLCASQVKICQSFLRFVSLFVCAFEGLWDYLELLSKSSGVQDGGSKFVIQSATVIGQEIKSVVSSCRLATVQHMLPTIDKSYGCIMLYLHNSMEQHRDLPIHPLHLPWWPFPGGSNQKSRKGAQVLMDFHQLLQGGLWYAILYGFGARSFTDAIFRVLCSEHIWFIPRAIVFEHTSSQW